MKTLTLLFGLISVNAFAQSEKSCELYNQSSRAITIFYQEQVIRAGANQSIVWPGSPPSEFTVYAIRKVSKDCFQKIGFLRLFNENGLIIFDDFLRPLPVQIKNTRPVAISLEYFDKAIFIPPAALVFLPDSFVQSDKSAEYIISEQTESGLGREERVTIYLEVRADKIYGEIP